MRRIRLKKINSFVYEVIKLKYNYTTYVLVYEVCSENNGNFLISRVWSPIFKIIFYYVSIHDPEV